MPPTLLFNRSDRARFYFSGAQITATLNGLVTNDVATLTPGQGQYAGILTPKSKILSDVRLFMLPTTPQASPTTEAGSQGTLTGTPPGTSPAEPQPLFLMDTSPAASASVRDFLKKYLNPRFAKHTDVSNTTADLGIFGDQARSIIAKAAGVDSDALEALTPYSHIQGAFDEAPVVIIRTPELGVEGYDIIFPSNRVESFQNALVAAGAQIADAEQWSAMRIAIGWPEWGVDMDDTTLPQEANFDELNALSHSKGCYIGHETIARIHFRGHVNKKLRRLAFTGPLLPPRNAELFDENGKSVGTVTSVISFSSDNPAISPVSAGVGIGMVRREIEDGTTLSVSWDTGTSSARIIGKAKGAVD